MRKLVLHRTVVKELQRLPAKRYRQVVAPILCLLAKPVPHYSRSLVGSDYSRIAVGEYRVVYRADEETIHVFAFGKRNDDTVYKTVKRLSD